MNVQELLKSLHIDGVLVGNVVQITADEEKVTVIYDQPKTSGETARRVITVESEAVTIDRNV